jgi:hypothetical protein
MNNANIIDVLSDMNEQLDKISLSEFLSVMTLVSKKIKSERDKLKESKTLSEKEINTLILLYEKIKKYLFDIFSLDNNNLTPVNKLLLLQEKFKKYLFLNNDTIEQISVKEMDTINKQCKIVKFDDIDEKINNVKEHGKTISIDEFDAIYECIQNTLNLLKQSVNKIQETALLPTSPTSSSQLLNLFEEKKTLIEQNEERIMKIIKQIKNYYKIFNAKEEITKEKLDLAMGTDIMIPLNDKVLSIIEIKKIHEKITKYKKQVDLNMDDLSMLISETKDNIEKTKDYILSDTDNVFIQDTMQKLSEYTTQSHDLNTKITDCYNHITKYKDEAYDNLAGTGIIKYEDYNNYKNIAGSDEEKKQSPLGDESIHIVLNNNIRLLKNATLEELYYVIDRVKNYLFTHQHFISKGILGTQWNFTKGDLNKYIENPKKGINNSTWPVADSNVPPLPNPVQMIALYLKVLINISNGIFEAEGQTLRDNVNLRSVLKAMFVDNEINKTKSINSYKYNGLNYLDAIKKNSGCKFYIDFDNKKIRPDSEYLLMGGKSYDAIYLKKYIKYKSKYVKLKKNIFIV